MEDAVLEGIPGTSLWGLKARAEEDARADGLFKDPLAVSWFQRLKPFFGGPIAEWYNPVLQQAIALRTDILDDAVRAHLARCREPAVVELGAGFSTRFSRLMPDCPWFELDLPEMIELRLSMGETPAPRHSLLADSIFSPDWLTALDQQDPEQIFLIAEGLLMYFPLSRVEQLFKLLNRSLPGAWIAFDVMGGWNVAAAKGPGDEVAAPIYWGVKYLDQVYQQFGVIPAGDLTLPTRVKSEPGYQRRIKPLSRWLLGQRWLTRRMGGTVLARLKRPE